MHAEGLAMGWSGERVGTTVQFGKVRLGWAGLGWARLGWVNRGIRGKKMSNSNAP